MTEKEAGYRESIEEIQAILDKIEKGETDVDELADEIKRAAQLLKTCKDKLFRMEQDVKEVISSID